MAQIEGDGQYDAAVNTLRALEGVTPLSVVSDYGGLGSKERCDVLRSYGADTLFVEAYADSGASHADLSHYVVDLAAPYGYDAAHAIPCMGTYRGETPAAYQDVDDYAGGGFSVYLIEPMSADQLAAWQELAAAPPPEPEPIPPQPSNGGTVPDPPKDTDCRTTVRFAAQTWEAQMDSYQARARLVAARRICDDSNTNEVWTKPIPASIAAGTAARDAIVAVLDAVGVAK
jgi:hypothetical protein